MCVVELMQVSVREMKLYLPTLVSQLTSMVITTKQGSVIIRIWDANDSECIETFTVRGEDTCRNIFKSEYEKDNIFGGIHNSNIYWLFRQQTKLQECFKCANLCMNKPYVNLDLSG